MKGSAKLDETMKTIETLPETSDKMRSKLVKVTGAVKHSAAVTALYEASLGRLKTGFEHVRDFWHRVKEAHEKKVHEKAQNPDCEPTTTPLPPCDPDDQGGGSHLEKGGAQQGEEQGGEKKEEKKEEKKGEEHAGQSKDGEKKNEKSLENEETAGQSSEGKKKTEKSVENEENAGQSSEGKKKTEKSVENEEHAGQSSEGKKKLEKSVENEVHAAQSKDGETKKTPENEA